MIGAKKLTSAVLEKESARLIGILGHLVIFFWALGMVLLVPSPRMYLAAALCLLVLLLLYPTAFRRLLRMRWLVLMVLLVLPNLIWGGEPDWVLWGLPLSQEGLLTGVQMALRAVVVLLAMDGFTASVDISAIAGLLERFGLQGLGFSMGVAINLLPALQQSSVNAWQSLWMRGGLRARRWRGLQLLLTTIIANALRRAEDIALAAEGRAFSPEHARPMPMETGRLDPWMVAGALGILFSFIFWR